MTPTGHRCGSRRAPCSAGPHGGSNVSIAGAGFDELRDLAAAAGDKVSLAIGMAGLVQTQALHDRPRESSRLASEYTGLLESIGDPTLTLGLSFAAMTAKYFAGEMTETLRLAQHAIDLADGDPTKGNLIVASPLAWAFDSRGGARWALGLAGWREDFDQAIAVAAAVDPMLQATLIADFYTLAVMNGSLLPDATALRDTAEALAIAERSGDDSALFVALEARGIVLVHQDGPEREHGFDLLAQVREAALQERHHPAAGRYSDRRRRGPAPGISTVRSTCPARSPTTCSPRAR